MSVPGSGLDADEVQGGWRLALAGLTQLGTDYGFAASDRTGLYHAMFGRDSLWMALFLLDVAQLPAGGSLRPWIGDSVALILDRLAQLQGDRVADETEEQPGRIIHEVQLAPTAHAITSGLAYDGRGRSFAGFDQTFLFVTTVRRFTTVFPDDPRPARLWPAADRALGWIEQYADEDGDGLYEYRRRGNRNLTHQVWKDSFDSITHVGFEPPAEPVAWIDVQGYAHQALNDGAALCEAHGQFERAKRLLRRASDLRIQTTGAYWLPDDQFTAIALDGLKRPIRMLASNVGHALWGGVLDESLIEPIVARLAQPDLTTRYGVRTLARTANWYAPFAYHRGNIWPFDNGVLAAGLLRYGRHEPAVEIMAGVTRALLSIGSPIELYIALDTDSVVGHPKPSGQILMTRHPHRQNATQGFTAAALLYFSAELAHRGGVHVGVPGDP